MADSELLLPGSSPDEHWVSVKTKLSSYLSDVKAKKLCDQSLTAVLEHIMDMYYFIRDKVQNTRELQRMGSLLATHGFVDYLYFNIVLAQEAELANEPGCTNLGMCRKLLCNLTDKSEELCEKIAASLLMEMMIKNLSADKKPGEDDDMSNYTMRTTMQMLTLYNVLYKCPGSKHQFRRCGGVEVMMDFVQSDNKPIKAVALLTVALAADLEESDQLLKSTESNITYMLWLVDECLKQTDHRTALIDNYFRFRLDSLLSGLVCLSRNSSNSLAIGRNGGFDRFTRILASQSSQLETQYTVETIWNLSFQAENKLILQRSTNLMKLVQELKGNDDKSIKIAAEGTCFEVFGRPEEEKDDKDLGPKHIMISYNWNDQELAKKLMKKLRSEGLNVWMDIDQMEGDMLEKMADAVENSHAVIVCLSEAYRDSANCRMEATYACTRAKPTVPVLMEEGFTPSGWLGLMLGMKLRYDLTKEFDAQFGRLLPYLRQIIAEDEAKDSPSRASHAKPKASPTHKRESFEDWSPEQVAAWWRDTANISSQPIASLDGQLLAELKKWRVQATEFFLTFSEQKLKITDTLDLIRFSAAIQNL